MKLLLLQRNFLFVTAGFFLIFTIALMVFPGEGLAAAKDGLKIFWEIVLPSLLPFFILTEILLGLGVVHFFGVILEPLMRPLFNVPGAGAFALSMGLAAGYPMDAVITGKFRRMGLCSRIEGERLLAFTNTADPLFMFGAVAVGMFGRPELGAIIALAHYLSAFSIGFLFRFYGRKKEGRSEKKEEIGGNAGAGLLRRAVKRMRQARKEDNRPVGQLLGDAVKESVNSLFMIGGFITLFSVLCRMLEVTGVVRLLQPVAGGLLKVFGLEPALASSLLKGFFEIDLGVMAGARAAAPLNDRLVVAGVIIAWSGLSVHSQVMSVIHGTDIRIFPYLAARAGHAFLAGLYTFLLNCLRKAAAGGSLPVTGSLSPGFLYRWYLSTTGFLVLLGLLSFWSILLYLGGRYRLVRKGKRGREIGANPLANG
ncbi:MAG: sporulation integral membrane protein YlbJ [Firmicutes bacterium]|jgi:sporulation integral membrane protein YlbJ|nr:sporulation integral membrane protein YlbJ [Bacillota bacterium]